jgi:hypothetical protein
LQPVSGVANDSQRICYLHNKILRIFDLFIPTLGRLPPILRILPNLDSNAEKLNKILGVYWGILTMKFLKQKFLKKIKVFSGLQPKLVSPSLFPYIVKKSTT